VRRPDAVQRESDADARTQVVNGLDRGQDLLRQIAVRRDHDLWCARGSMHGANDVRDVVAHERLAARDADPLERAWQITVGFRS
jgi:hypothetical protein